MAGSVSLREFGYNFCGPLLWSYTQKVVHYLDRNDSQIFCLAREGYLFRKALKCVLTDISPNYLYASRTFLFRISLYDPQSWRFSLTHGFDGTLLKFFVSRFGFSRSEALTILEGVDAYEVVTLPAQRDEIESILKQKLDVVEKITAESRAAYMNYLDSENLLQITDKPVLFLDIGYSGTIQKLLTLLLKRNTTAFYFITTSACNDQVNNYTAKQYYAFKDGVKMGDGYDLLDRSMFLESLFTSPDGQFIDIRESEKNSGEFSFYFGRRGYTQAHFEKLDVIFSGALDAVRHFNENQIEFSSNELETLYSKYVYHKNLIPSESWPLFEFDDAISGFGNVSPLHFFGL